MFGYATDETEECMPLTILLAHQLNAKMRALSKTECPWIMPDSKTQVIKGRFEISNGMLMFMASWYIQTVIVGVSYPYAK